MFEKQALKQAITSDPTLLKRLNVQKNLDRLVDHLLDEGVTVKWEPPEVPVGTRYLSSIAEMFEIEAMEFDEFGKEKE